MRAPVIEDERRLAENIARGLPSTLAGRGKEAGLEKGHAPQWSMK
jgi:hypothetical protein